MVQRYASTDQRLETSRTLRPIDSYCLNGHSFSRVGTRSALGNAAAS